MAVFPAEPTSRPAAGPSQSPLSQFFARVKAHLSRPSLLSSSGVSEDDEDGTVLSEPWTEYAARMEGVGGAGMGPEVDLTTAEGFVAATSGMASKVERGGATRKRRGEGLGPASASTSASRAGAGSGSGSGSEATAVEVDFSPAGKGDTFISLPTSGTGAVKPVHKVVLDADFSQYMDGTAEWTGVGHGNGVGDGDASSVLGGGGSGLTPLDGGMEKDRQAGGDRMGQGVINKAARLLLLRTNKNRSHSQSSRTSKASRSEHSFANMGPAGKAWRWCREVGAPAVWYFFDMSFPEKSKEREYLREEYQARRQLSIAASAFYLLSWILSDATLQVKYDAFDWYTWCGIYGGLTIPLLPLVILNAYYYVPWLYQVFLFLSTWVLPDIGVITMHRCGIYSKEQACASRSFYITFAAAVANPSLAVLALGQNRFWAIVGTCQMFTLTGILLMNRPDTPRAFYRDAVFGVLYNGFIIGISWLFERSSRQLFQVRQQLKVQYRATQRAQLMEKKAADLKKRFVSYIFHEVRVPLNTALLAVQNLDGERAFASMSPDQEEMVAGLAGSLGMMEKVLNDVLSFNRFESGRLSLCSQPFDLGRVVDLTAVAHGPAAHSKGLKLEVMVEDRVRTLGGTGLVLGDEMRLRQIMSNLVSNAIKFASEGSVTLSAKVLWSSSSALDGSNSHDADAHALIGNGHSRDRVGHDPEKGEGDAHERDDASIMLDNDGDEKATSPFSPGGLGSRSSGPARCAIIRLSVRDTGVGLRPADVQGDRLFSPYVQTELGRRQGGKGTGLGLALVYQIVQLSKGRLGVDSRYGEGSEFWLEMPFGLPHLHPHGDGLDADGERRGVPFATPPAGLGMDTGSGHGDLGLGMATAMAAGSAGTMGTAGAAELGMGMGMGTTGELRRSESPVSFVSSSIAQGVPVSNTSRSATTTTIPASSSSPPAPPAPGSRPTIHLSGSSSSLRVGSSTSLPLQRFSSLHTGQRSIRLSRQGTRTSTTSVDQAKVNRAEEMALTLGQAQAQGASLGVDPEHGQGQGQSAASGPGSRTPVSILRNNSPSPSRPPLPPQPTVGPSFAPSPSPQASTPQPLLRTQSPPSAASPLSTTAGTPAAALNSNAGSAHAPPTLTSEPAKTSLNALVVDDDKLTRTLMARMLKRLGHSVTMAEDGIMARDKLVSRDTGREIGGFDVVFLDNQMPHMTGVELAAYLRSLDPPHPVYIAGCTGNALKEDQEEYRGAGADVILTKPIKQAAVEEVCRLAAERSALRASASAG